MENMETHFGLTRRVRLHMGVQEKGREREREIVKKIFHASIYQATHVERDR